MATEEFVWTEGASPGWIELARHALGDVRVVAQVLRGIDARYFAMLGEHIDWHLSHPRLIDSYTLSNPSGTAYADMEWGPPDEAIKRDQHWVQYTPVVWCYGWAQLRLAAAATRDVSGATWRWDDPAVSGVQQYYVPFDFEQLGFTRVVGGVSEPFRSLTAWKRSLEIMRGVVDALHTQYSATLIPGSSVETGTGWQVNQSMGLFTLPTFGRGFAAGEGPDAIAEWTADGWGGRYKRGPCVFLDEPGDWTMALPSADMYAQRPVHPAAAVMRASWRGPADRVVNGPPGRTSDPGGAMSVGFYTFDALTGQPGAATALLGYKPLVGTDAPYVIPRVAITDPGSVSYVTWPGGWGGYCAEQFRFFYPTGDAFVSSRSVVYKATADAGAALAVTLRIYTQNVGGRRVEVTAAGPGISYSGMASGTGVAEVTGSTTGTGAEQTWTVTVTDLDAGSLLSLDPWEEPVDLMPWLSDGSLVKYLASWSGAGCTITPFEDRRAHEWLSYFQVTGGNATARLEVKVV